ncbi:heterokaryon incompatibility protein-domain-containing protein [Phaeosphaeria sp. MPI-PUGE-AT-0046c]|nr:heterokaryon incompatibility protein-domain-containing protein [Phaeosphaeria sp. MPI-PUGE-AT-0046c]
MSILEDILACIDRQFRGSSSEYGDPAEEYGKACLNGESTAKRLALVRAALHSRLDSYDHTFLVFDGYDRLSQELQRLLDYELSGLQDHRLRVLQTRRVPVYDIPLDMWCDGNDCEDVRRLNLYWTCKPCLKSHPDAYTVFCYNCKQKGSICLRHNDGHYEETYAHVNIHINRPDDLELYISRELYNYDKNTQDYQKDYTRTRKTTSPKAVGAKSNGPVKLLDASERMQKAASFIANTGNITIARLYLDHVHKDQSLDVAAKVNDRLPRNVIALFDAEMACIQQQPKNQSDIALMAIAAAADRDGGVTLKALEEQMRDAIIRLPHLASNPPRSLEDILRYANGFITEIDSDVRRVCTYNQFFSLYVREGYNETLFWAKSQLNLHRPSRSLTFQTKVTSKALVASPPTMDYSFATNSPRAGVLSRGSTLEYFDRSFGSSDVGVSPKHLESSKQSSDTLESDLGISMFGAFGRSQTSRLPMAQRRGLRNNTFDVPEMPAPSAQTRPQPTRSISRPSDGLCAYCKDAVLESGSLVGTYQRPYAQIRPALAERCIFCSILHRDHLKLSREDRQSFQGTECLLFHWTIRSTTKSRASSNSIVVSFQTQGLLVEYAKEDQQKATLHATNAGKQKLQIPASTHRFHLIAEHDLGLIPDKDDVGSTTNLASNAGKQVSAWIRACDHTHASCNNVTKPTWVPKRLLDLRFGNLSSVRLVNTSDEGIISPYATLSHCWGPKTKENEFITTQGETEKVYMTNGIKLSALSTNFQQAISVARFIGVRYIWIDSLCIIQGPASDFLTEGQVMHKVYRNSYCNIAAADSKDSRGGLFRGRDPADILPGKYQGDGSSALFGTKIWRIVSENLWEARLLGSSIYTRGWVFQERMLAPRVLHFTDSQIFWDCGTLSACEGLPNGLPLPLDDSASTDRHWRGRLQESSSLAHAPLSGVNDDSLEGFWSSAVLNYTRCDLTNQGDKSVAIWSIAKLVRDAWNEEYGAGLWGAALEEQLAWRVADTKASERHVHLQWKQPSWSWTSVQGAIVLPERMVAKRCYRVRGHDGHAISFKSEGPTRPTAEREHSDSPRIDVELGWKEWQKKTRTRSSPQIGRNMGQERSQSMPVSQTTPDDSTSGVKQIRGPATDPRDLEPKLASKSIAVHAPICSGVLVQDTASGEYRTSTGQDADFSITGHDTMLDVWLDETPSDMGIFPYAVQFLILTITEHSTVIAPTGLGIEMYEYDSDNEPDLPMHITYSGMGLLIIQSEEYLRRGEFHTRAEAAKLKLEQFLHTNSPIRKDSAAEWKAKGMQDDINALEGLIAQLERHVGTDEEHRHFRRTGLLQFQHWDEKMYRTAMEKPFTDFWLD